jgi:hypothetical protein
MPLIEKCVVCRADYEARRLGSMYCAPACKHRAMRRRQALAQELAESRAALTLDLLTCQTQAIADGADAPVLSALAREADALLGGDAMTFST